VPILGISRHLPVTRRYTLKLFSDGLIIMVGLSVLVFHHRHFRVLVNEGFSTHRNDPLGGSIPDPSKCVQRHFSKARVNFKPVFTLKRSVQNRPQNRSQTARMRRGLQDPSFNCKGPYVSAFLPRYIRGEEGSSLRSQVGTARVTSHQILENPRAVRLSSGSEHKWDLKPIPHPQIAGNPRKWVRLRR
jgi:hypothetical protein